MSQRLKRWESPRKEGRNDKGKGGSARQRQLKKRTQMLRQKLKDQSNGDGNSQGQNQKGENHDSLLFLLGPAVRETGGVDLYLALRAAPTSTLI